MKRFVVFLFLFFLILSVKTTLAFEYTIEPSLSLSEEYNDNIFLTRDRVSDFITLITPGIDLSVKSANSQLKLGYSPSFSFYSSHEELNETAHHFIADGNFILSDKLSFTLVDTFLQSSEASDIRTISDLGPITERAELSLHTISGNVIYKVRDNLSYLLGASYFNSDFAEPGFVEVKTGAGSMGLDFRYSARTTLSVNARYAKYDYRPSSDVTEQDYTLGVTYLFTPAFTVKVTGGLTFTKTEDAGESDSGFIGEINLTKKFEKGEADVSFKQAVIASIQDEEPLRESALSFGLSRPITNKWTASLSASFSHYESIETDNTDINEALFDAGLTYHFRPWAIISLSYHYGNLADKINDVNDYYNNLILLNLRFSYSRPL